MSDKQRKIVTRGEFQENDPLIILEVNNTGSLGFTELTENDQYINDINRIIQAHRTTIHDKIKEVKIGTKVSLWLNLLYLKTILWRFNRTNVAKKIYLNPHLATHFNQIITDFYMICKMLAEWETLHPQQIIVVKEQLLQLNIRINNFGTGKGYAPPVEIPVDQNEEASQKILADNFYYTASTNAADKEYIKQLKWRLLDYKTILQEIVETPTLPIDSLRTDIVTLLSCDAPANGNTETLKTPSSAGVAHAVHESLALASQTLHGKPDNCAAIRNKLRAKLATQQRKHNHPEDSKTNELKELIALSINITFRNEYDEYVPKLCAYKKEYLDAALRSNLSLIEKLIRDKYSPKESIYHINHIEVTHSFPQINHQTEEIQSNGCFIEIVVTSSNKGKKYPLSLALDNRFTATKMSHNEPYQNYRDFYAWKATSRQKRLKKAGQKQYLADYVHALRCYDAAISLLQEQATISETSQAISAGKIDTLQTTLAAVFPTHKAQIYSNTPFAKSLVNDQEAPTFNDAEAATSELHTTLNRIFSSDIPIKQRVATERARRNIKRCAEHYCTAAKKFFFENNEIMQTIIDQGLEHFTDILYTTENLNRLFYFLRILQEELFLLIALTSTSTIPVNKHTKITLRIFPQDNSMALWKRSISSDQIKQAKRQLVLATQLANIQNNPLIATTSARNVTLSDRHINLDLTRVQTSELQCADLEKDSAVQPAWFKKLSELEQKNLPKPTNNSIGYIPCTYRKLPGLRNLLEHTIQFESQTSTRYSSGILIPVDIKNKRTRSNMAKENVAQLSGLLSITMARSAKIWGHQDDEAKKYQPPILIQTLLSPTIADSLLPLTNKSRRLQKLFKEFGAESSTNSQMVNEKEQAIADYLQQQKTSPEARTPTTIISTNHPINSLRKLPIFTKRRQKTNIKNAKLLIGSTIDFLTQVVRPKMNEQQQAALDSITRRLQLLLDSLGKNTNDDLTNLSCAIGELLTHPLKAQQQNQLLILLHALHGYIHAYTLSRHINHHKGLFKSSFEQIIVEQIGGVPYGSCKSSKDRKGIEFVHTDAMYVYYDTYKKLPKYGDEKTDRDKFIDIFADLYESEQVQRKAELNAPGARGIKNPGGLLPDDISRAIMLDPKTKKKNPLSKVASKSAKLNKPVKKQRKAPIPPPSNTGEHKSPQTRKTVHNSADNNYDTQLLALTVWKNNALTLLTQANKAGKLNTPKTLTTLFKQAEELETKVHSLLRTIMISRNKDYALFTRTVIAFCNCTQNNMQENLVLLQQLFNIYYSPELSNYAANQIEQAICNAQNTLTGSGKADPQVYRYEYYRGRLITMPTWNESAWKLLLLAKKNGAIELEDGIALEPIFASKELVDTRHERVAELFAFCCTQPNSGEWMSAILRDYKKAISTASNLEQQKTNAVETLLNKLYNQFKENLFIEKATLVVMEFHDKSAEDAKGIASEAYLSRTIALLDEIATRRKPSSPLLFTTQNPTPATIKLNKDGEQLHFTISKTATIDGSGGNCGFRAINCERNAFTKLLKENFEEIKDIIAADIRDYITTQNILTIPTEGKMQKAADEFVANNDESYKLEDNIDAFCKTKEAFNAYIDDYYQTGGYLTANGITAFAKIEQLTIYLVQQAPESTEYIANKIAHDDASTAKDPLYILFTSADPKQPNVRNHFEPLEISERDRREPRIPPPP
ncbi:MAG: hypothetical protein KAS93_01055 [Gammaproteobacteria bacterium]|nr:hypothetical protein [Gammaproteobacteria bacterium]